MVLGLFPRRLKGGGNPAPGESIAPFSRSFRALPGSESHPADSRGTSNFVILLVVVTCGVRDLC